MNQDLLGEQKEHEVINHFKGLAPNLDVLIFSDFSYGVLSSELVQQILQIASSNGIFVSADSQ